MAKRLKKPLEKQLFLMLMTLFMSAAGAQSITSITINPTNAEVGQAVKVTVDAEGDSANCGLRIEWGNGEFIREKVSDGQKFPVTYSYAYKKAGEYNVIAKGEKVGSRLPCVGKASSKLAVASVPVARKTATTTAHCPADWVLDKKSINKKTGAYWCKAKQGAKFPEAKFACGDKLNYAEKKGMIGCQP